MTRIGLFLMGVLAIVIFATSLLVIIPNTMIGDVRVPKQLAAYTSQEARGRQVYVAEGCVYCHSQQVRDPVYTSDKERGWGPRATVPSDYIYDKPHQLGTMRTGPDLINIGVRQPSDQWHHTHLFNPRSLMAWSIMPAFPYLYAVRDSSSLKPGEVFYSVAGGKLPAGKVIVPSSDSDALVAYLKSLKRTYPVPSGDEPTVRSIGGRSEHTMP
jgi:cytochrome c oxidase cbb3-type subunit II